MCVFLVDFRVKKNRCELSTQVGCRNSGSSRVAVPVSCFPGGFRVWAVDFANEQDLPSNGANPLKDL